MSDQDGDPLVAVEATNPFSVLVVSTPDLVPGGSYDISFDGSVRGTVQAMGPT